MKRRSFVNPFHWQWVGLLNAYGASPFFGGLDSLLYDTDRVPGDHCS